MITRPARQRESATIKFIQSNKNNVMGKLEQLTFLKWLRRMVNAWCRRHWREKIWLVPAFVLLGCMRAALLLVPFRHLAPFLGRNLQASAVVPLAGRSDIVRAGHIGAAIRTAARCTPWESKCLAQAMAARLLLGLNRIPYGLYLGLDKRNPGGMTAHAWVHAGSMPVTGGDGFGQFTVVSTFVAPGAIAEQHVMSGTESDES